jgi:hypothetical protein
MTSNSAVWLKNANEKHFGPLMTLDEILQS